MEAYRDQYATLFNNGRKVVVIGISIDADSSQYSWARDANFPILFASDPDGKVGKDYGAWEEKYKLDNRSLYVIDSTGKIAYKTQPFRQSAAVAYEELGAVIDKLSPPPPPPGQ
ncbi:MAG: redoxin domain-containing protein [Gemmatimonadaceae bacterium]